MIHFSQSRLLPCPLRSLTLPPFLLALILWFGICPLLPAQPLPALSTRSHPGAPSPGAITSELIGRWPGDGDSRDTAGGNNSALRGGIDFQEGKIGQAFRFDGIDDYVTTPFKSNYFFHYNEGGFTLATWVRPVPGNEPQTILVLQAEDPDFFSWEWGIYLDTAGHFVASNMFPLPNQSARFSGNTLTSKTVAQPNTWYFVVFSYRDGRHNLYVNGNLEASIDQNSASITGRPNRRPVPRKGGALTFGRFPTHREPYHYFRGLMDDVRLYDRVLSSREVEAIFSGNTSSGSIPAAPPVPVPHSPIPGAPPALRETTALDNSTLIRERRLAGHTSSVTAVAFSPDGTVAASGDTKGVLNFWSTRSGELLFTINVGQISTLDFAPDSRTLAVGCGDNGAISFVDIASRTITESVRAPGGGACTVQYSPRGDLLASGDGLGTVAVWDVFTKTLLFSWKSSEGRVTAIAFSPDGRTIASANADGIVKLWTINGEGQGQLTQASFNGSENINSLAFSPDDKTLFGGSRQGAVRLWDLLTKEIKDQWVFGLQLPSSIPAIDLGVGGKILAVARKNRPADAVQVLDSQTGQLLHTLPVGDVNSLAFFPYGRTVITGSANGQVSLWYFHSRESTFATAGSVPSVIPLTSNEWIFFHSNRDGNDEIYSMSTDGRPVRRLTQHPGSDGGAVPGLTGDRIAFTSNRDGNLEVYSIRADGTGETRLTNNPGSDIAASWNSDGLLAFYSNRSGNYDIYLTDSKHEVLIQLTDNPADDIQPAFSPDGRHIAFVSRRDGNFEIYVMAANGNNPTRLTRSSVADREPIWSPDGKKIVWSRKEGERNEDIYIMNADGSDQTRLTDYNGKDVRPTFAANGQKIIFASDRNGNMELYAMDVNGGGVMRLTNNPANELDPYAVPVTTPRP